MIWLASAMISVAVAASILLPVCASTWLTSALRSFMAVLALALSFRASAARAAFTLASSAVSRSGSTVPGRDAILNVANQALEPLRRRLGLLALESANVVGAALGRVTSSRLSY